LVIWKEFGNKWPRLNRDTIPTFSYMDWRKTTKNSAEQTVCVGCYWSRTRPE